MKRFGLICIVVFATIVSTAALSHIGTTNAAAAQEGHEKKHEFEVRQYDEFHDVLHPLQHDALPKKDFRRLRAKSALLVKRGNAIVRLGVPRRVQDANKEEFATELSKFRKAIARFKSEAKKSADDQFEAAFNAVHDSFEMLVAMLPRG